MQTRQSISLSVQFLDILKKISLDKTKKGRSPSSTMQFLPLYVTKKYIDPFPKLVINKSSYLPAPDEVCQSRLACYQTLDGCFALEDKIKKSLLLRMDGELFR